MSADALSLAEPLSAWFVARARALPWRAPDRSPWGVLVSEVMLQQTQVDRVLPAWESWMARWPTPAALAVAEPGDAVRAWGRLGYPRRAVWLHDAAGQMVARFEGAVPGALEDLLALRGIGPYTARAVAVFAFGQRHPVVDTNTRRVVARAVLGRSGAGAPSASRDLADLEAVLPDGVAESVAFNQAIMELGALVCTARAPRCGECPIAPACAWRLAGFPADDAPGRRPRQARYEGSDRQARGALLAVLRDAERGVNAGNLLAAWPADAAQAERALASLAGDGLVVVEGVGDARVARLP